MTDDEKRQCKSDTLEELAEVRAKRRCLVTRAEKIQRQLERGTAVMKNVLAAEPGQKKAVAGEKPEESDWPSYADIASIHGEMWETCDRIHVLNGRLREWGVID